MLKIKENVTIESLIDVSPSDSCFLPEWYWQQTLGSYSLFLVEREKDRIRLFDPVNWSV